MVIDASTASTQTWDSRRIVHVSYQDPHHLDGGQGVAVLLLCMGQISLGHDLIWLSPCIRDESPGEFFLFDGRLRVVKLPFTRDRVPTLYSTDDRSESHRKTFATAVTDFILRQFRPQDVYIHLHGFLDLPGQAGVLIRSGYEVTSTYHMLLSSRAELTEMPGATVDRLRHQEAVEIAANSNIIVHSHQMRDDIYRRCRRYAGRVHVMPCGVGEENFASARVRPGSTALCVAYGRISPEKGFSLFIEAAKIVADRCRIRDRVPIVFNLFGKSDETIAARREYRTYLDAKSKEYPEIQLEISREGIWGQDRIDRLDQSRIGVVPSSYEPYGIVMAEMMARGLPIISTLTHGSREMLETDSEGETKYGLVVEREPGLLADAIEHLVDNPRRAAEMGRCCREKAERQFRLREVALQAIRAYQGHSSDYTERR